MNCSKTTLFLCLAIHVTSGVAVFAADDPLDPLNRRVGDWVTKTTYKKAAWTPEERTVTGVETIKWILDDKFIQGDVVVEADDVKSHWLMNYDAEAGVYRMWFFDNQNSFPRGETVGRWDEEDERMDWKVDIGNEFRGAANWKYSGKDQLEWSMTISDPNGDLMLDMRGSLTRKEQDSP